MSVHELKTWPMPFRLIEIGVKTFEIRKNDRDYREGDILILKEYLKDTDEYTGRRLKFIVTYILQGEFGLPSDICCMSIIPFLY